MTCHADVHVAYTDPRKETMLDVVGVREDESATAEEGTKQSVKLLFFVDERPSVDRKREQSKASNHCSS